MPQHAQPPRDPRSIVTPDAFEISNRLLGLPLAAPRTRLAALLIDLVVIGAITLLTKSFALILGVLVAFLFIREGFKRTQVPGSVFGRAMRLSVGCLGVWVGIVTVILWMASGIGGGRGGDDDDGLPAAVRGLEQAGSQTGLGSLVDIARGLDDARRIAEATSLDEAQAAATALADRGLRAGLTAEQVWDVLVEAIPDDRPWSGEAGLIIDRALSSAQGATPTAPEPADAGAVPAVDLSDPAVADTLRALEERIARLANVADARAEALDELEDELDREREGGTLFGWLRDFADELGFGFGWASLYLTVMLSWWKGQTVGKRAMGIRVMRLDGEPITWWTAFERAGGYAAGFATGLLGFAQVYWDANRQAIHDRIVGTVVVIDRAPRVIDWEHSL